MKFLEKLRKHVPDYSDCRVRDENGVCQLCDGRGRRLYLFLGRVVEDVCHLCEGAG